MAKHALVHTDGASKGNPGRAGIGVAVYTDNELVPAVKLAERLPDCTNNVAEYTALLRGLDIAAELGVETVEVRTDSELMAKQIAGSYSVKAPDLIPLYNAARQKLRGFRSGKVTHVRRGFNAVADELANVGVSLGPGQSKRIDADGPTTEPPAHPVHTAPKVTEEPPAAAPPAKSEPRPVVAAVKSDPAPPSAPATTKPETIFTWLGHGTVHITTPGGINILLDAFTESNPACPQTWHTPPIDYLCITHGHNDHMQDAKMLQEHSSCTIVAIAEITDYYGNLGVSWDKLEAMNRGGTIKVAGGALSITMVTAVHSSTFETPAGTLPMGEAAGFIIRGADIPTIYFAGDTNVFGDMKIINDLYEPEIAFLPIGDRFTMGPREAAYSLGYLPAVTTVIPMHYATFSALSGTPGAFRQECADQERDVRIIVPSAGEPFTL
jgi:L-ascorbate metabolism protein UlaG (beta-lactamase superfamily)/ribonuclease HI